MITLQHIYETEGGLLLLPPWHGEADGGEIHMTDEALLVKGFGAEKHVCLIECIRSLSPLDNNSFSFDFASSSLCHV